MAVGKEGDILYEEMMQLLKTIYVHYLKSGERQFQIQHTLSSDFHADKVARITLNQLLTDLRDRGLIVPVQTDSQPFYLLDQDQINVYITDKGITVAELL